MQHALLLQIAAAGSGGGSGSHTIWEVPEKAKVCRVPVPLDDSERKVGTTEKFR
jgi:hypothetical protein